MSWDEYREAARSRELRPRGGQRAMHFSESGGPHLLHQIADHPPFAVGFAFQRQRLGAHGPLLELRAKRDGHELALRSIRGVGWGFGADERALFHRSELLTPRLCDLRPLLGGYALAE